MDDKKIYRETFNRKFTNTAQLNAGVAIAIEYQTTAQANKNLPHNTLFLANQDANCTLYLYLDDYSAVESPDYVVYPNTSIAVNVEEGITFTTLWIRNNDTVNNVAANKIKGRLATVKRVAA